MPLRIAGLVLLAIVAVAGLIGYETLRLGWLTADAAIPVLTGDQKADDMAYLLDLTHRASSAEAAWTAGGLDNPLDHRAGWIERARATPDNAAFADLALQYTVHLRQVGHAGLRFDVPFTVRDSLVNDIARSAYERQSAWANLVATLPWNAHATADVRYQAGRYVLETPFGHGSGAVPPGSAVESVDGQPVDAYVMGLQYRDILNYDPALAKWFAYPLFRIDPGPDHDGWDVAFRRPDGSSVRAHLPKVPGDTGDGRPPTDGPAQCIPLAGDAVYIRIPSFDYRRAAADGVTIRRCFEADPYRYATAIFDVRGNAGGEIWSYLDNVIAPLTRTPVSFSITSAVRDSFYSSLGWRFTAYQLSNDNELTERTRVSSIAETTRFDLGDGGWRVVTVTRRVEPDPRPFPFDGMAYVLADARTASAGDSFVAAMGQTGLATVVGASTDGLGEGYQSKMRFALPNSGLIFDLEIELTANPDGTLNNVVGTRPDVALDASTYPTPVPTAWTKDALLADPWIAWCLRHASAARHAPLPRTATAQSRM